MGQTPQNSWDKPAFGTSPLLGFTPTYPPPHALAPMLFISGRSIANLPMQSELEFSIKATVETKAKICAGMTGLGGGFGADDSNIMEAPSFVVDVTNTTPEMVDSESLEVEAEEGPIVDVYPWNVQVFVYGGSRTEGESSEGKHTWQNILRSVRWTIDLIQLAINGSMQSVECTDSMNALSIHRFHEPDPARCPDCACCGCSSLVIWRDVTKQRLRQRPYYPTKLATSHHPELAAILRHPKLATASKRRP